MNLPGRRREVTEEELDRVIRSALQDEVRNASPSPDVWARISSQVSAGPPRRRRPPSPSLLSRVLAPLAQGLAATAILLLLGLSLGPNLWIQSYRFGAGDQLTPVVPVATEVVAKPVERIEKPVEPVVAPTLSVIRAETRDLRSVASEPGEPSPPALNPGTEDMLNAGLLLRYRETIPEQQPALMPQIVNPELDPVLTYHRSALSAKHPGD